MVLQREFTLRPRSRGFHLVTDEIVRNLPPLPEAGLPCTSSSATPRRDFRSTKTPIPTYSRTSRRSSTGWSANASYYTHNAEGDDDMPAHAKSALTGVGLTIPIVGGRPGLGTWQGIYLCEFRNRAAGRRIVATVVG